MREVIYGFDPLCGWCYGLIPAWRAVLAAQPDLLVDVVPGGLITGARIGPYTAAAGYIRQASARMEAVTGQRLGDAFFQLIEGDKSPVSASAPPSYALLQAPEDARLSYAHALQEAHFARGADLSQGAVLAEIARALGFEIDGAAAQGAKDDTPRVAAAFARAKGLGISSFPTTLVVDQGDIVARVDGEYDPQRFTRAVLGALNGDSHAD
ncbi:MAG: DsbA family protein [Pseudomonadota bacterium]